MWIVTENGENEELSRANMLPWKLDLISQLSFFHISRLSQLPWFLDLLQSCSFASGNLLFPVLLLTITPIRASAPSVGMKVPTKLMQYKNIPGLDSISQYNTIWKRWRGPTNIIRVFPDADVSLWYHVSTWIRASFPSYAGTFTACCAALLIARTYLQESIQAMMDY